MTSAIDPGLEGGILRRELLLGVTSGVSASNARVNLSVAGRPTGSHFETARYGRGEVGEIVIIEGQVDLVLGRLVEVRLPEGGRRQLEESGGEGIEAIGVVQFLGSVRLDSLRVSPGVASFPRLGDRVYAAPHSFVGRIPQLMEQVASESALTLHLGHVGGRRTAPLSVRPEKLFGRHCAVLGATGGGKSWTVARILEECATLPGAKVVLLDATGEYRTLTRPEVSHFHLGNPVERASSSVGCGMPPSAFQEVDFIALFEPAGKVQGPKLREAIRSLRLLQIVPELGDNGVLKRRGKTKKPIEDMLRMHHAKIDASASPFDCKNLAKQLLEECVYPEGRSGKDTLPSVWGDYNDSEKTFVIPLASRVHSIVTSTALSPVFDSPQGGDFDAIVKSFINDADARVLRICMSGVAYDYRAREFIANAMGRTLLHMARAGTFRRAPVVVVLDEAHNFLGRSVGHEESAIRLDAFEIIAREGRKYGLNLCLATQRPRDLTEGVLSQMGTLVVHRLTNERDREIVERACGEVDRSATAFLANLRQGEAVMIGVDFPIPLTVHVVTPSSPPASDGPDYQTIWARARL